MSNTTKKSGPFDVKTVEALVELMAQNDLSEIYLRDGNQHLRVRRGSTGPVVVPAAMPVAAAPLAPARAAAPAAEAAPAAAPSKSNFIEIKSETVGTFYAQGKPGEPPFVKKGDRVTPNKVVGLVEVMKTYSEILANCTGVVVEILVESGKYVEFGEVLFRVDPT